MKKLGPKGQRWLKGFHSLFACAWIGADLSLCVKNHFINPTSAGELFGIVATMDFINKFLVIPGAMGVFLTGIVYSIWTNWGWFKHNWITVKWAICIFVIGFGTYPLGPWMTSLVEIAGDQGLAALSDPTFVSNRLYLHIFGTLQISTLILAVFLSALKPWKKEGKVRKQKLMMQSGTNTSPGV
jgi:uncharacterized membrane protein